MRTGIWRAVRRAGLATALFAVAGCSQDSDGPRVGAPVPTDAPAPLVTPSTRAEFLDLVAPVPGAGVTVRYSITGPAGLDGELVVDIASGGLRREMWSMTLSPGQGLRARRIAGLTIQTADTLWTGVDDTAGETTVAPLGSLADAYMAADEETRRTVARHVQRWRDELSAARASHQGRTATVADQQCLETQIAGQSLCVWEETGLPLRYRSAEFALEAFAIERDVRRADDSFVLPDRAQQAKVVEPPPELTIDAAQAIDQIAAGNMEPLAFVVTPGLRMPG
jgi:hypothetical protein